MLDVDNVLILQSRGVAGGECGGRSPLGGSARSSLLQHLVDLLEGKALGLRNNEVRVDQGRRAETTPNPEDIGLQVASVFTHHVGGNNS